MSQHNPMRSLAALLCACAVATILLYPDAASAGSADAAPIQGMTDRLRTQLLNAHNAARANVSPVPATPLPRMTWDPGLEALAQSWANTCPTGHNPDRHYVNELGRFIAGENIAFRTNPWTGETLAASFDSWTKEAHGYDYARNTCTAEPCGHYTQVVWQTSTRVGCGARSNCPEWPQVLVCNYFYPGNFNSQRPYTMDGGAMTVPEPSP